MIILRRTRATVLATTGLLAGSLALAGAPATADKLAATDDNSSVDWSATSRGTAEQVPNQQRTQSDTDLSEAAPRKDHSPQATDTAAAATPSGDYLGGAWLDPDEASTPAARDLRVVDLYTRKSAGIITAVATFDAAPTMADTVVIVYVGTRTSEGCLGESAIAGPTRGGQAEFATFSSAGGVVDQGKAGTVTMVGKRTVIQVKSAKLVDRATACAYAYVTNGGATTFDTTGFIDTDEWAQHLEWYFGHNIGGAEGTSPHTGIIVGKNKTVRVGIRNSAQGLDNADVTNVQMKLAGGSGVSVTPSVVNLGTIELVDDKFAKYVVRLKKRQTRTLTWTVVGDYGVTSDSITVHPLGSPVKLGRSLVGKRFWAPTDLSWKQKGIWFVNAKFAYIGFPKSGGLPTCRKVTSNGSTRGCVKYSWNSRSKALRIAGKSATVKGSKVSWRGAKYRPMVTPKPGSRWFTTLRHTNATTSGTLEYLDLYFRPDGRFWSNRQTYARQRATGRLPDGQGTYQVGKAGLLTLKYSSGRIVKTNVAVLTGGDGRPNPWDVGLFIGDQDYSYYG